MLGPKILESFRSSEMSWTISISIQSNRMAMQENKLFNKIQNDAIMYVQCIKKWKLSMWTGTAQNMPQDGGTFCYTTGEGQRSRWERPRWVDNFISSHKSQEWLQLGETTGWYQGDWFEEQWETKVNKQERTRLEWTLKAKGRQLASSRQWWRDVKEILSLVIKQ